MTSVKFSILCVSLLLLLIWIITPSRDMIIQSLESQHLPTPIFANWFQLLMILWIYGK
jgi:hypothetical protein